MTKCCIKCGCSDFYASGDCKACARARAKSQREKQPEKLQSNNLAYRSANVERTKKYKADYYVKNKKEIAAKLAAKHRADPSVARTRVKAWAQKYPEKVKAYAKEYGLKNSKANSLRASLWGKANPDACRIKANNRRARKLQAGGRLSKGLGAKLFALQKGMCPCCKQPLGDKYHLDHKMPLALGGSNTDDNMQLLRQRCNNQKYSKHPVDFMQSRGFLL